MLWRKAAIQTEHSVLRTLHSSLVGLSPGEADQRLLRYGENRLPDENSTMWRIFFRQFRSSFVLLVLGAAVLSLFLGERIEGGMMFIFVLANVMLGFFQEYRSVRTLAFLKQYLSSSSHVRRDGREFRVPSENIVPGDIVLLSPGDIASADMRILESVDCAMDEETLTGESLPAAKKTLPLRETPIEPYQASNIIFAGTKVVRGRAAGLVLSTGKHSALGDIAVLSKNIPKQTAFESEVAGFSRVILRLVTVTISLVFFANLLIEGRQANVIELLVFSVVLVVSVIPEALPFVITVSLSRGSLHLAKKQVVVKRLSAIEDLGDITVLCTDKTGTITENHLVVERVFSEDKERCLFLASVASPFAGNRKYPEAIDPFDRAVWERLLPSEQKRVLSLSHEELIPFDPDSRRNGAIFREGDSTTLVMRGAPETVLAVSKGVSIKEHEQVMLFLEREGQRGRRVLALAEKSAKIARWNEDGFRFVGLISFSDPLKKTAIQAVKEARRLGVAVKILTGDAKDVAGATAQQVGLVERPSDVLLGKEFSALSEAERREAVRKFSVFARLSPREKYEIVTLLREKGSVGFLGEGMNDAPALRVADVGLVVSGASAVAVEAADVVLLRSSLKVIVDGIREGRSIFANLMKYIRITLASNFGNFLSVAVASLFIPFVPMLPLQILLLAVLSDFPMIAIAGDSIDGGELKRPGATHIRDTLFTAAFLGLVSSAFDFIYFTAFLSNGEAGLQTNWYVLSLLTELVAIVSLRTTKVFFRASRMSSLLLGLSIVTALIGLSIPFLPFGKELFGFADPTVSSLLFVGVLAVLYLIANELVKRPIFRFINRE